MYFLFKFQVGVSDPRDNDSGDDDDGGGGDDDDEASSVVGPKEPKPGTSTGTEKPTKTRKHKKKKVEDALLTYLEQLQQQGSATSSLRAKVIIKGLMRYKMSFNANT